MRRSGNPFVDTGLSALTALSDKFSFDELNYDDLENIFKKHDISALNSKTKSFTMIFGTNGPLYQNAYKPHNKDLYRDFLEALLDRIDEDGNEVCEICGERHGFDIDIIWREVISKYGFKAKEKKYVGRDFFPLIGSIGNDAQALPSASRVVSICPKCLFAVNYIPLGTMLIKGRLVCIESTSETLMIDLTREIVHENLSRISSGNKDIYGKKEGNSEIYKRLLDIFSKIREVGRYENLPDTTAIYLWLFSNSGTGADCDMIEVPNKSLRFIWETSRQSQEFKNQLTALINKDKNGRFFDCINFKIDFEGLYPKGKYTGVIPEFYECFEKMVVGKSSKALNFARKLAINILEGKEKKELAKLQKSDVFKERENVALARKKIVDMILEGTAGYEDYLGLFNSKNKYLVAERRDALNTIMYYLCNPNANEIKENEYMDLTLNSKNTDKKIKIFAELYFKYYVYDKEKGLSRGIERFKKEILDNFKEFNEFRLKTAFAKMADVYECEELNLSYDGWLDFITDDEGNKNIYELLFQLRLAFAELYRKYSNENKKEETA